MQHSFERKPIGNFFILKDLQIRLIVKIVVSVVMATFLCLLVLLVVYYLKYKSILLYQMDSYEGELSKENIIFLLLPSLVISSIVNIILAVAIGMYASRKYAVPIYKLEHWAQLMYEGHLSTTIQFREKAEFKDLTTRCNTLAEMLQKKFKIIKEQLLLLPDSIKETPQIKAIEHEIEPFEIESSPIEINTSFYNIAKLKKNNGNTIIK